MSHLNFNVWFVILPILFIGGIIIGWYDRSKQVGSDQSKSLTSIIDVIYATVAAIIALLMLTTESFYGVLALSHVTYESASFEDALGAVFIIILAACGFGIVTGAAMGLSRRLRTNLHAYAKRRAYQKTLAEKSASPLQIVPAKKYYINMRDVKAIADQVASQGLKCYETTIPAYTEPR